jgi:hypothetical protein
VILKNLSQGRKLREWDSQGELSKVPMVVSTMATISERSFSVGYPAVAIQEASFKEISPGAIVSDQQDSVLGVLGVFYNDVILASHPHSTSIIPQIPPVSNISSIGDLLSTETAYQTWANLPLQAVISTNVATGIYTRFSDDNGATSQALSDLETELGNALPANELKGYQRVGYPDYDGSIITVIYAFPVILRLLDGTQLAKARWVGIQWNRKNNAPNRLFYGNEASTVLGGHYLVGDVSTLDRGVSTLLPYQGSNGTVTVTASTPH